MSTHCFRHDRSYPSLGQCPECRAEEAAELRRESRQEAKDRYEETREREEQFQEEQERRHEELREWNEERAEEAERRHEELKAQKEAFEDKRQNPGEYKCPECLFVTLRRSASRCPICHATISPQHWTPILEQERIAAEERERQKKIAAEEWARGEPERRRQAEIAAEVRRLELDKVGRRMEADARRKWTKAFLSVFMFYALPCVTTTSLALSLGVLPQIAWWISLVPAINWLGMFVVLLDPFGMGGLPKPSGTAWSIMSGFELDPAAYTFKILFLCALFGVVLSAAYPTLVRSSLTWLPGHSPRVRPSGGLSAVIVSLLATSLMLVIGGGLGTSVTSKRRQGLASTVKLPKGGLDVGGYPAGAEVPCDREKSLRSLGDRFPATVEFVNRSQTQRHLFWLNYAGERIFYLVLNAQQSTAMRTFLTHPWLVADEAGNCIIIHLPASGSSRVVLSK